MSSYIPKVQDGPVPLPTQGAHGEDDKKTATATCYCGTVQLEFVRNEPRPCFTGLKQRKETNILPFR